MSPMCAEVYSHPFSAGLFFTLTVISYQIQSKALFVVRDSEVQARAKVTNSLTQT